MMSSFSFLNRCDTADGVMPICVAVSFPLNPLSIMLMMMRSWRLSGAWSHTSSTMRLNCRRRLSPASNDCR